MIFALCPFSFFFFNDTATTEIYTLSLHDALPICPAVGTSTSTSTSTGQALPHRRGRLWAQGRVHADVDQGAEGASGREGRHGADHRVRRQLRRADAEQPVRHHDHAEIGRAHV